MSENKSLQVELRASRAKIAVLRDALYYVLDAEKGNLGKYTEAKIYKAIDIAHLTNPTESGHHTSTNLCIICNKKRPGDARRDASTVERLQGSALDLLQRMIDV